ncbi:kinase-like protein [Atractiella rhizophila]|nr:kinase-like protein [Atractiella rhizophila]
MLKKRLETYCFWGRICRPRGNFAPVGPANQVEGLKAMIRQLELDEEQGMEPCPSHGVERKSVHVIRRRATLVVPDVERMERMEMEMEKQGNGNEEEEGDVFLRPYKSKQREDDHNIIDPRQIYRSWFFLSSSMKRGSRSYVVSRLTDDVPLFLKHYYTRSITPTSPPTSISPLFSCVLPPHPSLLSPLCVHTFPFSPIAGGYWTVSEYVRGSVKLAEAIKRCRGMQEEMIKFIAKRVGEGIAFLHRNGVILSSFSSKDILLGAQGEVKICGFENAVFLADIKAAHDTASYPLLTEVDLESSVVYYSSPERLERGHVSEKTDVWAFGILLYEMLTSLRPYDSLSFAVARDNIVQGGITISLFSSPPCPQHSSALRKVLERALAFRPEERLGMDRVLREHFFRLTKNEAKGEIGIVDLVGWIRESMKEESAARRIPA